VPTDAPPPMLPIRIEYASADPITDVVSQLTPPVVVTLTTALVLETVGDG